MLDRLRRRGTVPLKTEVPAHANAHKADWGKTILSLLLWGMAPQHGPRSLAAAVACRLRLVREGALAAIMTSVGFREAPGDDEEMGKAALRLV